MTRALLWSVILVCVSAAPLCADWRQFRGNDNRSVAEGVRLPTEFSVADNKNVAWKSPLVGRGVSSPIVVQGRVIVTASDGLPPAKQSDGIKHDKLFVLAFDAGSGKLLWKRQFWATGRPFCHPTSAVAAPTPASDGERVFAFYSSNDLVCLDLDGNLQWMRGLAYDYPRAGNDVGMSSSPLVVGDTVVVQIEGQGDSFAAGLNSTTGELRWRIDRSKAANWCSPTALRGKDGAAVVLLQSGKGLSAHEPATGKQIWQFEADCAGIPSVVASQDRIYLPSKGVTALDATATGSAPSFAWESPKLSPGNPSPIVHDGHVYTVSRAGILTCGSEKDGEQEWQLRLKGSFWATPIAVGDLLYCVNHDGLLQVVKLGGKGEVVGTGDFGEQVLGSPAVSDNGLFVRSDKHLWKIAAP